MCDEDYYGDDQAAAEEAAYQEMCEAGADSEADQLKQMAEALEKGTINKTPSDEFHNCIEREQMLNEEKRGRRNR